MVMKFIDVEERLGFDDPMVVKLLQDLPDYHTGEKVELRVLLNRGYNVRIIQTRW